MSQLIFRALSPILKENRQQWQIIPRTRGQRATPKTWLVPVNTMRLSAFHDVVKDWIGGLIAPHSCPEMRPVLPAPTRKRPNLLGRYKRISN